MKAIIDDAIVADASDSDLISIEGNYYFPPSSISPGVLSNSSTPYHCPWKGHAQYHDLAVHGAMHHDAAWSYPDPYATSFERVGKDYSGYIAFDKKQAKIAGLDAVGREGTPGDAGARPPIEGTRSFGGLVVPDDRPSAIAIHAPAGDGAPAEAMGHADCGGELLADGSSACIAAGQTAEEDPEQGPAER
jgi:uncharacterized protein (DUF427 family)